MRGIVSNYNKEKGYGFIDSNEFQEDIFVHISEVQNASELSQGQEVKFQIKKTKRGVSAIDVKAGVKQKSPYFIFGFLSAIINLSLWFYLYKYETLKPLISYFIAINITTFILYGYDKIIAGGEKLRVPEWNLHALAIVGGSPAGLLAQKFFRHKTIKGSFQLVYWGIVIVQIGIFYWLSKS